MVFPYVFVHGVSRMWMVVRWTDMTVYVYSLPDGMSSKCIHLWGCLELLPKSPQSSLATMDLWCTCKGHCWCDLSFWKSNMHEFNCWYLYLNSVKPTGGDVGGSTELLSKHELGMVRQLSSIRMQGASGDSREGRVWNPHKYIQVSLDVKYLCFDSIIDFLFFNWGIRM